jgi:hypothetical protein
MSESSSIPTTPESTPTGPIRGAKRPPIAGRNTLSHQLRAFLTGLDLPTAEVARVADVDPKILSRFLAGKPGRGLTMATADRIAVAFGLKLGESFNRRRPDKGSRPRAGKARAKAAPPPT